jgi:ABC-type lipoprotein release transport system permease subunit
MNERKEANVYYYFLLGPLFLGFLGTIFSAFLFFVTSWAIPNLSDRTLNRFLITGAILGALLGAWYAWAIWWCPNSVEQMDNLATPQ